MKWKLLNMIGEIGGCSRGRIQRSLAARRGSSGSTLLLAQLFLESGELVHRNLLFLV